MDTCQQCQAKDAELAELRDQVRGLTGALARLGSSPAQRTTIAVSKLWEVYYKTFEGESWATSVRDMMKAPIGHFSDRQAGELRRSDWAFYRDQVCRKRKTRMGTTPSVTTRNIELSRFKTMLNWAVDQELLETNPLARVKKEQARPARETIIGDEGLEALLSRSCVLLRAFILVAIDSGMRKSEVRNLKWSQVEDSGRVRVSWTVAKTKRSRSVRLSERALDALDELPRSAFSPYVFVNADTGRPWSKSHMWELFREACVEAKLEAAEGDGNVHFHDARHDYITRSIQNGTPMVIVMRAAGHVTLSQASRYMHVDETDLDSLKTKNDQAIAAGPRKSPQRSRTAPMNTAEKKNSQGQ